MLFPNDSFILIVADAAQDFSVWVFAPRSDIFLFPDLRELSGGKQLKEAGAGLQEVGDEQPAAQRVQLWGLRVQQQQ